MKRLKNHKIFIEEMVTAFPEIKSEVFDEDYLGAISLQIGCFRRFTQRAIDANKLDTVKKCFEFIDSNTGVVDFEIENSLCISYLGKLNIAKNSSVERLLSDKLKNVREQLTNYYESTSKNERLNSFLDGLKDD
jgi:hypothetical protein